ncbi:FtsW/RodA/SpoVE family cell cycle protein [Aminicella lysinilytica]|uniref:FtsW/RodA/SpoVE family cell cycle protein n=1 Tax=Aminicella lysinilytica TaxID=433323 RepID=UPI0026EB76D8|nr:FtsW/RodA/SpoVE family cell cycle protein [Aminicella lysinilytica]
MEIVQGILEGIGKFFGNIMESATTVFTATDSVALIYTAIVRWVFIFLALFILLKSILSLLKSKNPSEVWAYLHIGDYENLPLTHWENVIGRAKSCDIQVDDLSVSRNHGTLTRDNDGIWTYMDLGSKNGAIINGVKARPYIPTEVKVGDTIMLGAAVCTLFPISLEEHRNNVQLRTEDTRLISPWPSLLAITLFQILTVIQLHFALGEKFTTLNMLAFAGLCALMWAYVIILRTMRRKGFELEIIAFFLSTLSLAVTSSCLPDQVFKQFIVIGVGVALFFFMCTYLRDLDRTIEIKKFMYIAAALLLLFNLAFATTKNGASNWIQLGGFSFQPSEIVKLAFIWVGAASMDELFRKKNSLIFTGFSVFCFGCLALMGDFGTAIIFFVTFLIISFLRSGDFTKLILIVGVAFVGGLLVIRFKSYVADRFAVWGHVWEYADSAGYQQTRTMSAAASGGFVGLGAGKGWLRNVVASETDLVFGVLAEEWGLIIAIMAVMAIITLSIFAFRSIWAGRSTYYTIAACSAMSLFLFQTILNVFGSVDLFPLTGVTFPFVASGGTSMIASWGLLAFLKAADTRQNASIAVSMSDKGLTSEGGDEL